MVFGADEYGKPRAARFAGIDPKLPDTDAEAMNLRLFEVTAGELAAIAKKLPAGRLHANGQGFVPYIKGPLYAQLVAATVGDQQPPPNPATAPGLPRSWDEIAPGHLVVAQESLECGWWEAIVIERNADMLTVRYRDYPKYPKLVRHRSAVELISPGTV